MTSASATIFPSLSQGQTYQHKAFDKKKKREGFSLTRETNNVISSNDYSGQQQMIDRLRQEYANALQLYQTLESNISGNVSGYFNRINPTNPYLNQTIQFSTGELAYVTNQGVAKFIPNTEIQKSLNIPTTQTNVNIPWLDRYKIPGSTIPTNPPLMTGTPMQKGQQVGNEGENVFVNALLPQPVSAPEYMGCYATNSALTYIGNTPSSGNAGTADYQSCQQSAISGGYQYFGLQNIDASTGQGYCVVSNNKSDVTSNGLSTIVKSKVELWSSNTSNQTGNTARLSTTGSLQVINSSGKSVYSSPSSKANPSNYFGCYSDASAGDAMTMYNNGSQQYSNSQCQQIAQQNGYDYYGLQNSTSGTNAQCALSNNFAQSTQYGSATNCTNISDGSWSGGGLSNAIYSTTGGESNYYLILENDGNMCVYRGTGPTDSQGYIWGTDTNGKEQDSNPSVVASLGKYGQNYMGSGFTLAPGDFIGSKNGKIALEMKNDGNLVLYAYQMESNCQSLPTTGTTGTTNGLMGGGVNANAMYDVGIKANLSNMGALGYIDADSHVYTYPNTNQEYTTTYTEIANSTTSGNDIQGASFGNATTESCQSACNANSSCAGVVFDSDGNNCYPKTNQMYPFGGTLDPSTSATVYVRGLQPSSGISSTTVGLDSVSYASYVNKGKLDMSGNQFGLSKATNTQKQQLSQLEDVMNMLSSQITSLTTQFQSGAAAADSQTETNTSGVNKYLKELSTNEKKLKMTTSHNVQHILNDSDIMVLQQNYKYLFWSILAAGTALISMNIMNKPS